MRFFIAITIIVLFMHIGIKEVSFVAAILMFIGVVILFAQDLKEIFK